MWGVGLMGDRPGTAPMLNSPRPGAAWDPSNEAVAKQTLECFFQHLAWEDLGGPAERGVHKNHIYWYLQLPPNAHWVL